MNQSACSAKINKSQRLLKFTLSLATTLTVVGPNLVFGQTCIGVCADQFKLLSPFIQLQHSPEGLALLNANLLAEETIYLSSTPVQKNTAATNVLLPYMSANIMIGAFPGNSNFTYDAQTGLPSAPPLPSSIATATGSILNIPALLELKTLFGQINVYGETYNIPLSVDPNGDPAPFQVSAAIGDNPFTPDNSSLLASQIQQTNYNNYGENWQSNLSSSAFPSGHALPANINAISYAILAPGYYQQLVQSGVDFAYSLNVYGFHYPLDVIGARILATYTIAQTLAGNPQYPSAFTPENLTSLSQEMQGYLSGGGSSPYAAQCAGGIVGCVAGNVIPSAAAYTQARENYTYYLTYDLPSVGDTSLPPVVPSGASWLLATRFPYLNGEQRDQILATTELPSGVPLDNGSGWARLNLYAAAGGYGAFSDTVTVNMHAELGGLNAFDIWGNNISGPGGLTLQGSGILILAGNNSYTGGTNVQGGTLAVTGTLGGDLAISPGAVFVSNGGYGVASNATLTNAGTFIEVNTPLMNAGSTVNTGTLVGDVYSSGYFNNNGRVTGAYNNAGLLSGSGIVGSLDLLPSSTIAPGNSVGTFHVEGNMNVAPGAIYLAQVETNGADLILVGDRAILSGGTVVADVGINPVLGRLNPILMADGGVFGTFTEVSVGDLAFIQPRLNYDANNVFLTLSRNEVAFASVAATPNQVAVANAISAGPVGSDLDLALLSQSATGARQAFDALSGEIYASSQAAMLEESLYLREIVLGRMRQASFAGGTGAMAALGSGGPNLAYAEDSPSSDTYGQPSLASVKAASSGVGSKTTFWTQGGGAWGRIDDQGNAAEVDRTLAGFFCGIDRRTNSDLLAGLAGGYTHSSLDIDPRLSSADIDSGHLAAYLAAQSGSWNFRSAMAVSFGESEVHRSIVFPGFAGTATADTDTATAQIFGEMGYGVTIGQIALEPFGGLAFVHLTMDSFSETGEASFFNSGLLSGSDRNEDIGYSTLGGRVATNVLLGDDRLLTLRASAAWVHALDSVTPSAALRFQGTGAPFTSTGVPLARDSALVEGGLKMHLNQQTELSLSISSQFGDTTQENAVQGNLIWRF